MAGGCSNSLTALDPSCAALRARGGFDKRFWVGSIADLDAVAFGSDQEVTSFTFASGKGFKTFVGKRFMNSGSTEGEVGEVVVSRVQNFIPILYARSAAERASVEALIDAVDIFVVAESNDGTLEVFGINKGANSQYDDGGLNCSAFTGNYGKELNDGRSIPITLSGKFDNGPLIYNEGTALATNITALDAQVV